MHPAFTAQDIEIRIQTRRQVRGTDARCGPNACRKGERKAIIRLRDPPLPSRKGKGRNAEQERGFAPLLALADRPRARNDLMLDLFATWQRGGRQDRNLRKCARELLNCFYERRGSSDRCPALPIDRPPRSARPRCSDAPIVPAGSQRSRSEVSTVRCRFAHASFVCSCGNLAAEEQCATNRAQPSDFTRFRSPREQWS